MDIFNLQNNNLNNQVFLTNGSTNWQIWQKPRNCKFVFIFILGGGGGGGSGASSALFTATIGGGGGGGASAITRAFFPANLIPDTLYIQVGVGGDGGTPTTSSSGNTGNPGSLSYVSILPSATTSNILVASGSVVANGGSGGIISGSFAAGGSAGQAFLRALGSTSGYLNYLGNYNSATSQGGGNGNLINGSTVSILFPVTGGGGGAGITSGTQYAGGSITITGDISGATGGVAGGGNGNNGPTYELPSLNSMSQNRIYFIGGAGGGASVFETSGLDTAGRGGNGSYGCGGGGGGAISKGSIGRTSGAGGRGGDGLVIINCW